MNIEQKMKVQIHRYRQGCGSGSVSGLNLDWECGSLIRGQENEKFGGKKRRQYIEKKK
jgi:hypothetical protein